MTVLSGKTVVVTGGGRGIGRAISVAMGAAGAAVIVVGRTMSVIGDTADEITASGGVALALAGDITDPESLTRIVSATVGAHQRIDCWVNNAGSARQADVGPLITLTEAQWDAVVDLNLKATVFACQAAARAMANTGGGSIINISSRAGTFPSPNTGHYGAAKAGLNNITATMAAEWGHLGIRVNAVAPGVVITDANTARMTGSRRQRQIATVPMQRLGAPEDVAPLCVFLASDGASWISGAVIPVNGGSPLSIGYLSYLHSVASSGDSERNSAYSKNGTTGDM